MTALTATGLRKAFGTNEVIRGADLDVFNGEMVAIIGPSGCGKTTLLRLLAGLEVPDAGTVTVDGVDVRDIPTRHRRMGFVFQSFALYSHLTVAENIGHPLRVAKVPASERRERVDGIARQLGLSRLLDRTPSRLSGGEAQRVALARALIKKPRLLLLDEPASNLDQWHARRFRDAIRELHDQQQVTSVYVSHDQEEAFATADRIAVMQEGRILQIGTAQELLRQPAGAFVAMFLGDPPLNLFDATIEHDDDRTWFSSARGRLRWSWRYDRLPAPAADDRRVVVGIRSYYLRFGTPSGNEAGEAVSLRGRVLRVSHLAPLWRATLDTEQGIFTATTTHPPPAADDAVDFWFDARDAIVLDAEDVARVLRAQEKE